MHLSYIHISNAIRSYIYISKYIRTCNLHCVSPSCSNNQIYMHCSSVPVPVMTPLTNTMDASVRDTIMNSFMDTKRTTYCEDTTHICLKHLHVCVLLFQADKKKSKSVDTIRNSLILNVK